MASYEDTALFSEARAEGRPIVTEHPRLDLESYIANYKGKTRIDRLYLIGTTSTQFSLEALKLAVATAKRANDVVRYKKCIAALAKLSPNDPDAVEDESWEESVAKQTRVETDRLEVELKGYKNNLIKESIRMGHDDLGQHYHQIGDLGNASKAFNGMRQYCINTNHSAIMYYHLIHVNIDQQNWLAVQSNAQKLRGLSSQNESDAARNSAKISAVQGLADLAQGDYRGAANHFLNTDPRMLQARLDDVEDEEAYNEILTPNDIAIYGALCALASMERGELQLYVLDNAKFRPYLELEPHLRRALSLFVSSKFSQCLSILESYRPDYLLDLYLQQRVREIYFLIRSKAITQYFIPFSCVTLASLAKAFHASETQIEYELVEMIKARKLNAKLDLEDRLLIANTKDPREVVHDDALKMAKGYQKMAQMRILRMEILAAGLEVKSPKEQGKGGAMGEIMDGGGGGSMNSSHDNEKPKVGSRGGGFWA
ncbi:hypothetical protein MMC25_001482 [Agyrium rufum]|nr:hypothetical protein [Agyrium rufum]